MRPALPSVRNQENPPKKCGICKYAAGADLQNKKIVLVKDVVSSGGALIEATKLLRSDGIKVDTAICVIDRQTGGKENPEKLGVTSVSLLTND